MENRLLNYVLHRFMLFPAHWSASEECLSRSLRCVVDVGNATFDAHWPSAIWPINVVNQHFKELFQKRESNLSLQSACLLSGMFGVKNTLNLSSLDSPTIGFNSNEFEDHVEHEEPFPQQLQFSLFMIQFILSISGSILNGFACIVLSNSLCRCYPRDRLSGLASTAQHASGVPCSGASRAAAVALASANRSLLFLSFCELGYCSSILGVTGWQFARYLHAVGNQTVFANQTSRQQIEREKSFDRELSQAAKWSQYLLFVGVTACGAARNWWLSILTCVRAVAVVRPHYFSVFMTSRILDITFFCCCFCAVVLGILRFGFQFAGLISSTWKVQSSHLAYFNFTQRVLRSVLSCVVILLGSLLIAAHLAAQRSRTQNRLSCGRVTVDTTIKSSCTKSSNKLLPILSRSASARAAPEASNDGSRVLQCETRPRVTMLQKKRQQATVVVLVLAITFSLLETPTVVISYSMPPSSKWHDIFNQLLIVNACVNFIIFMITKEDFRVGLRHLTTCCCINTFADDHRLQNLKHCRQLNCIEAQLKFQETDVLHRDCESDSKEFCSFDHDVKITDL